jgi:hypothetical protein
MHPPAPAEKKMQQPLFSHQLHLSNKHKPKQNKTRKTKKEAVKQKTLHHHFQNKRKHNNTPQKF